MDRSISAHEGLKPFALTSCPAQTLLSFIINSAGSFFINKLSFDVDLFVEFFQGFVNHALVTLHVDNLRGHNAHHQAETVFKAFGRAMRMALTPDPAMAGITPSTKGTL